MLADSGKRLAGKNRDWRAALSAPAVRLWQASIGGRTVRLWQASITRRFLPIVSEATRRGETSGWWWAARVQIRSSYCAPSPLRSGCGGFAYDTHRCADPQFHHERVFRWRLVSVSSLHRAAISGSLAGANGLGIIPPYFG